MILATGPVATVLKNTRVDEKRRAVARRAKSACSAVDTRPTLPSSRRGGGKHVALSLRHGALSVKVVFMFYQLPNVVSVGRSSTVVHYSIMDCSS